MAELKLKNSYSEYDGNDNETRYDEYGIVVNGIEVGTMTLTSYDTVDDVYCDRIDIDEEYRNQGYGTQALKMAASQFGSIWLAPDNEDAQRLYERIGEEDYSFKYSDVLDQGFGMYVIC